MRQAVFLVGGSVSQAIFPFGGDGTDGAVTFDGVTTVLGLAPAANVYTLTRDIFCTQITINAGVTIKSVGFAIFCQGVLLNNGTIQCNGGNGNAGANSIGTAGGVTGGAATAAITAPAHYTVLSGVPGGSAAGGAGATGNGVEAGPTGTPSNVNAVANGAVIGPTGPAGGAGGNGGTGTGGIQRPGGNSVAPTISRQIGRTPETAMAGASFAGSATLSYTGFNSQNGGSSAGSGGGGDGVNAGGGGGGVGSSGAVGGAIGIFAATINNNGTIQCNGGNGGAGGNGFTPTVGNTGGGGAGAGGSGGPGGIIWLVYGALNDAGNIQALGGAGGAAGTPGSGFGGGTAGGAGAAGIAGMNGIVIKIPT